MSCEHLVCANCAGRVVEARCAVCRESRAHVHVAPFTITPQLLVALVAVLVALGAVAAQLH